MRALASLASLALFLSCARAVESADRLLVVSKTLLSTTGDVLDDGHQAAFQRSVQPRR